VRIRARWSRSSAFGFRRNLEDLGCQQTGEVVGGTGEFAAASGSFAGELSGSATLARNPDGSCSQDTSRIETTEITSTGTLSF
jgi:hypothetical protein